MNLRNVLRAYSLLRQLSDDESALLETLRQTNDSERALLVEALSDKPQKKSNKKAAGKSRRAERLSNAVTGTLQQMRQRVLLGANDESNACTYEFSDSKGTRCGMSVDDNVHHKKSDLLFHPFSPAASSAPTRSATNGGGDTITASTGTEKEDVGSAVHGASGGD